MQDDLLRFLKTLTVGQLKSVAQEHGIDISSCGNKKSCIQVLAASDLTKETIEASLAVDADAEAAVEMDSIHRDLEDIAEKRAEPMDVSESESADIERSIDKALLLRPLFFEIDSASEHAWNKMILGDFSEALRLNMESRAQMIERLSTFHLYSTALSIRAAETLMWEMKGIDTGIASGLKTALAEAKEAFMNGPPKRRETTLEEIEALTSKAVDAFLTKCSEAETELRTMLDEYASFGVHTHGATELLEIAICAKCQKDFGQYSTLLEEVNTLADRAKGDRMKQVERAFEQVRNAIDAAKEAGVDTKDDEAQFNHARKAFKDSDFKGAMALLAAVEQAADRAHLEKVRADGDAEIREIQEITSSMRKTAPDLEEAAMYGLDVQQGLLFVSQAETALEQRDVVEAAKYSRRVRKLANSMEKDIRRLRAERGIVKHVEGGKCGECGKESLYAYPDGKMKCDECGHAFSTAREGDGRDGEANKKPAKPKRFLGRRPGPSS
ncbi:MAG TPA: hypothetical protein VMW71_01700 [Thermoplasmata archaeon]|nr:hypothetical protein [Thermoplasmata archaeon]